jgi:heterodisulfide reductase subunit A
MPKEKLSKHRVASIVIAVGYDSFDPRRLHEYGYGKHPDILTALEFERLVNSAGPTGGEIVRPSDGVHPESILFVLCVGSRDQRAYSYCSRFCCMYSLKHAYQALDHHVPNVTVMYMDIRAYGKGFDGFWGRTREAGARFIRARPAGISPNGTGKIQVVYEEFERRARTCSEFDMVVLANAVAPPMGIASLAKTLGIELDEDGFIRAQELAGGLVTTTRPGIYSAGCVSGPKDIPDSVAEGSGAAALALSHVDTRGWPEPVEVEPIADVDNPRVGVFVCHCGSNIAGVVDVERVVRAAKDMPDVAFTSDQMFSCAGNTQHEIEQAIREHQLNRVVIAACSPKTHESIFRGVLERAGLNPFLLEMSNIRNMDSWVHKGDHEAATRKAIDMVLMAVEKARRLTPLESKPLPLEQSVLVIGGGIAGMTAALALEGQGFETHLVEQRDRLGGELASLYRLAPAGIPARELIDAKQKAIQRSGVHVHLSARAEELGGYVGNFNVRLSTQQELNVGGIVVATGGEPYTPDEFEYGSRQDVITNLDLERILANGCPEAQRITFISCIGSRQGEVGCSRYCCSSMIDQALELRRRGKHVRILSKDIRTYSRQAEERYEEAMRAGVQFFRYDDERAPQGAIHLNAHELELYDENLGHTVRIPSDLIVLVVGLRPRVEGPLEQLKLAHSEDGFFMELHPKLGPAETAIQGIYLAGTAQGAKDVRESMAQALAAAGKAGALLSRGVIEKEPLTAWLIEDLCKGCMRCVKVCPYAAIDPTGPAGEGVVLINEAVCMGCGNCAAECNFDAIQMPYFTTDQMIAQIDAALAEHPEEKCLVFTCNWCSYAGADLAGIEKRQYPPSALIIRTMCSARFDERFVARAFELGAGAVLITGCRLTDTGSDCHYNYANRLTWKRFQHWQRKFSRAGIAPERLQLRWISAAEGKEFAEKIAEMDQVVQRYVHELREGEGAT